MVEKLVVCIMGQNCERFIEMCLESLKDTHEIIYCDGGSTDRTLEIVRKFRTSINTAVEIIENKYDQEDKGMNGITRNFYLDYLKKKYKDYWCLCLDADEVVEDLNKIKNFINIAPVQDGLYSIKMRHFIQDLGHEDSTLPVHFVPNRLFKIRDDLFYPETEHPILQSTKECNLFNVIPTTIWHNAYIPNLFEYKKKYENHLKKSEIHTKEFLNGWYRMHIFGSYPKKQIDIKDIPCVILKHFGIDPDELYFADRGLEIKHFIMASNWYDYFKPKSILDIGCGMGHYLFAFKVLDHNMHCLGIDKSEWIIRNQCYQSFQIHEMDITKEKLPENKYDLVLVLDILEHIKYEDIDVILNDISKTGSKFIFSIPFVGDPNLENDKTHIIKEDKEWWLERLSKFFIIKDAPKEWMYANQLLVGEKK